jgi:hypothetical protein
MNHINNNSNNNNDNDNNNNAEMNHRGPRETPEERAARIARAAEIEAQRQAILRASDERAARFKEFRVVNRPVKRTEPEETPEERAEREASIAREKDQVMERNRLKGLADAYSAYVDALSVRLEAELRKDRSIPGDLKEAIRQEVNPTKIILAGYTWIQEHHIPRDWFVIDGMFQPRGGFPDGIIPIAPKRAPIVFTNSGIPLPVKKGRTLQDMRAASESGSDA